MKSGLLIRYKIIMDDLIFIDWNISEIKRFIRLLKDHPIMKASLESRLKEFEDLREKYLQKNIKQI